MLLALALLATPALDAHAATLASFKVEGWDLGAYTNDQTGEFSHCAASMPYQSGITMALSVTKQYGWSVAFYDPAWKLTKDVKYNVLMSIDGNAGIAEVATALSPQLAQIYLPDNLTLFNSFRKGYRLKVDAASGTFYFNLTGTSAVLTSLLQCVQMRVAPAPRQQTPSAPANPFSPEPQASTGADGRDLYRAEATTLAANILSTSGIAGFHMLAPSEIAPSLKVDAAWRAGDVMGAINVVPVTGSLKLQDFPPAIIGDDAKSCQGKFASGTLPDSNNQIVRVFTSCNDAPGFTVYYILTMRPGGGFYRFTTMVPTTENSAAEQADTSLRQAVVKTLFQQ